MIRGSQMHDELGDGEMIEIGDPTEEPPAGEAPPSPIVIQYHERGGVPWMLIPPLLLVSAVGAVLVYHQFAPPKVVVHPVEVTRTPEVAAPQAVEPLAPVPASIPSSEAPAPPPPLEPPPVAVTVVEPPPLQLPEPQPAPFPRVQGLGFDPKALENERKVEAPADAAIAPAAKDDPPVPHEEQPREVDPDLLPPDPREARLRQAQRRVEALRKVEDERTRFHAEVRALCKKFGEDAGPEIRDLSKNFDSRVEPLAEKRAVQLLGKSGAFAGADRRTRIELLRSLGYPEPVILGDLFDHYEKRLIGERDGPQSPGEAFYRSALVLLRHPPHAASRPVSAAGSPAR